MGDGLDTVDALQPAVVVGHEGDAGEGDPGLPGENGLRTQ